MSHIPPTVAADAPQWVDTAARHTALVAAVLGVIGIMVKVCAWIRRKRAERKERKNALQKTLDDLCAGQADIHKKLEEMDAARAEARANDLEMHRQIQDQIGELGAALRINTAATGAALDGLMQLSPSVNGPVKRWRERLENVIADGIGGH